MKIPPEMPRLKSYRFAREIVTYPVWAYQRFALSTADVDDLLAERGVIVSPARHGSDATLQAAFHGISAATPALHQREVDAAP